ALDTRGLSCPRDVSITGYNDLNFVGRLKPPLTTVRVPLKTMGELAARALVDWIGKPAEHTAVQTLLPVEFVERGTTMRDGMAQASQGNARKGASTRRADTALRSV